MPDPFDTAEGETHSTGDGCEPPHPPMVSARVQSDPATFSCGCGASAGDWHYSGCQFAEPHADVARIKGALSRIQGKALDNRIIRDMTELVLEVERLQAESSAWERAYHAKAQRGLDKDVEIERLRAVVAAARDHVNSASYQAGHPHLPLAEALAALDRPNLAEALKDAHHRRTTGEGEWTTFEEIDAQAGDMKPC